MPPGMWKVEYWRNTELEGRAEAHECADDIDINYDECCGGGPHALMPTIDNFAVRWTKTAYFSPGTYMFKARSDDGSRVRIKDGDTWRSEPVMDQWGQCCRWWDSSNIQFGSTTEETTIVFEMREFGGAAYAHLVLNAVAPPTYQTWYEQGGDSPCNNPHGGRLTLHGGGEIAHPAGGGNYRDNEYCMWRLDCPNEGDIPTLAFASFNTEQVRGNDRVL